jgi:hypothetical protein
VNSVASFSPLEAATAGWRVARREPKAVLGWVVVWAAVLIVLALAQVYHVLPDPAAAAFAKGPPIFRRFGSLWPFLVASILILGLMTVATVYRAVIHPEQHGWRLFQLGVDEFRMTLVLAVFNVGLAVLGSTPGLAVFFLVSPVMGALGAQAPVTIEIGALITVVIEIWIGVRLSLTAVHSFADGKFHFLSYWRLTRGYFWRMFLAYLVVLIEVLTVIVCLLTLEYVLASLMGMVNVADGLNLFERGEILAFALVTAVFSAVVFVLPILIISACQAHIYCVIVEARRVSTAAPHNRSEGQASAIS